MCITLLVACQLFLVNFHETGKVASLYRMTDISAIIKSCSS